MAFCGALTAFSEEKSVWITFTYVVSRETTSDANLVGYDAMRCHSGCKYHHCSRWFNYIFEGFFYRMTQFVLGSCFA